ncbi:MAG: inositol monophosphatase [candidate division Zixibacteria bacterium]|nr:inositol monophosphatase [candidate division Zixibacteria bacterium]
MVNKQVTATPDVKHFHDINIKAAKDAGNILRDKRDKHRDIKFKGSADLVTDADTASEEFIVDLLSSEFPEHSIVAEEGSDRQLESDYVWIIDPLDGTTNYAHNFPVYCVSVGLMYREQLISGVVYNPVLDETFSAIAGEGAYLNGQRIEVSRSDQLKNSLLATGFPYDKTESEIDNINYFSAFTKRIRGIRRAGAAALDMVHVACGRLDGYWELKLKAWDIAAGALIVKEAGGEVSGFHGEKLDIFEGRIVASNGKIHAQMVDIIKGVDEKG